MLKISFIFSELCWFFFLTLLLPALFLTDTVYYFREGGTRQIALFAGQEYSFHFDHPAHLNSLSLRLKNPLIQNNSRLDVSLQDTTGQTLADFVFYGANVGDPGWIDLNFPPQNQTTYALKITTDNPTPESLFLLSDPQGNWDLKTTYQTIGFFHRLHTTFNFWAHRLQNMDKIYLSLYLLSLFGLNWWLLKK